MSAPLRIALLHPCYWPEVRRGSERIVAAIGQGLTERGHDVRLITSHRRRPTVTVEEGVRVERHLRVPTRRLQMGLRDEYLAHLPFVWDSLRRGGDDIVHAFYPSDAALAGWRARRSGPPVVFSLMGLVRAERIDESRLRRALYRQAVGRAAAVTGLSSAACTAARDVLGADAEILSPGVDLARFTRSRARAPRPVIFFPGAADDPRKRLEILLAALPAVRARWPTLRVALVRPPPASGAAQHLAARELVDVIDYVDPEQVVASYSAAWVTVLPSRAEAFGLVLVESLACGTPVIGADDGAIPEIVNRPPLGRMFVPDDPGSLAGALIDTLALVESGELGGACRERAEDFSWARTLDQCEALYRRVLAPAPPASRDGCCEDGAA